MLRVVNRAVRKALRTQNRFVRYAVIYSLMTTPANYMVTALSTKVPLTNKDQVMSVMKEGGLINQLTMGFYQPLKSYGQLAYAKVGEVTNLASAEKINQLRNDAKSWIDRGKASATQSISGIANQAKTESAASNAEWSFEKYPEYYSVAGPANLNASEFKAGIQYSPLDNLGRTGMAKGTLTSEMAEKAKGHRLPWEKNSEPSGWPSISGYKNEEVTIPGLNRDYHGWMYNKSHLIANQLGGAAKRENVITGTRGQNVGGPNQRGGMRYIEKKTVNYLLSSKGRYVYYKVTPNYKASELVPRTVTVQAMSDDKTSINETVVTYNTANGWSIDYTTGRFAPNP